MNKDSEDYKSKEAEFIAIQERSQYHLRLYIKNCTKDNFEIDYKQKASDNIASQMLASLFTQEDEFIYIAQKAVVSVIRDMKRDDFDKDEILHEIKKQIINEYETDDDITFSVHDGLFLEVQPLSEDDKKGFGVMAVRIPPSKGMFFSLLIHQMLIDKNFRELMKTSIMMAVSKKEPDSLQGKLAGLLNKMSSNMENDDCDCPNCVERRAMQAEGKSFDEIKAHFEAKDDDEDGFEGLKMEMDQEKSPEDKAINIANEIIEGTHDPYKED